MGPYFADFACHEQRLIVEVDGSQHNRPDHLLADATRTEYLASRGYRVLRFWNNDVLKNIDGVMESIYAALRDGEAAPPPLTPPHRASRGGRGTETLRPVAENAAAKDSAANYITADSPAAGNTAADPSAVSRPGKDQL